MEEHFNQPELPKPDGHGESELTPATLPDPNLSRAIDIPNYYSKKAISFFSVFFSVIFGAVLFTYNVTDKTAKRIVIAYGIVYTILVVILVNQGPRNTMLTIVLNGFGGMLLTSLFWNKYIGKHKQYRPKPIWKPLIISIIISLPFVLAAVFYRE